MPKGRYALSGLTRGIAKPNINARTGSVRAVIESLENRSLLSTTLPAPTAVGQGSTTAPGPQLDSAAATFQWNAVTPFTGFTGYQVNAYDQTSKAFYSFKVGTSVTSYTAPSSDLTPGDDFVWNVRVIDGTTTGPESAYLNFVVPPAVTTPLPAPVAVGQGTTATPYPTLDSSSPTFQWDAVAGVSGLTGYQINAYNQTTSTGYTFKVGTSVTSFTAPSADLTPGDTYVWNVRIIDGSTTGPESAYLHFVVPAPVALPAPVATGPGSTAKPGPVLTTSTPTLSWQAVTGVSSLTGYQIYLTDETAGKTFSYQTGASVDSFTVPTGTLAAGDTFVWDVRVIAGSQDGPPSTYLYFQTAAAVTTTLPAPVAIGQGTTATPYPTLDTSSPTFQWDAVTGATNLTGYQIYLTDETAGKTFSYQTGASLDSFTVPTGTLAAGDTFVWNVRVIVGTQDGPPSSYLYFQTPPPVKVTLPAPVATGQGSTTTPYPTLDTSSPMFAWNAITSVTGLTGYQINLYDLTASKGYSYQLGTSVTSFSAPSTVLTAGDDFVWNVRALAGTQSGPPSSYLYFQAPGGTGSANPPTVGTAIAAATAKLTHVEALQHKVVKSLKTATPGTTTYTELKQKYAAWEKRIKALKVARADLESEI